MMGCWSLLFFSISCSPLRMMPKAHTFVRSSLRWSCSTTSFSDKNLEQSVLGDPLNNTPSAEILRKLGCSDTEISRIFMNRPSLCKAKPEILQLKLNILRGLGFISSDVVKLIHRRPRLLCCRTYSGFDERINFLENFFGSREMVFKAILRNPALLNETSVDHVKRSTAIYEGLGISRKDLIPLFVSRPALFTRTKLDEEKLEYIHRTGVSQDSKMYKYIVSHIAGFRIETIREKFANLAKFGFSEDEVMGLFGRSPVVLSLSVDKVQRNMTFILGTMKLDASIVLRKSFLLFTNLETVLKPRVLLLKRINAMGLVPQIKGPAMMRALRITELRFLKKFVDCHDKEFSETLLAFYEQIKRAKRLAEGSKQVKIKRYF